MNSNTQQRFPRNRTSEFKQYLSFDKKFGYLHEIREVPTQNSKTYTARIAVPVGQGERMNYVNFELYIKSADALLVFLEKLEVINDDETKVTIRFSCTNTHPRAYVAKNGQREGQAIPYMGGNLSYLYSMKVDGHAVYGYGMGEESSEAVVEKPADVASQRGNSDPYAVPSSGELIPFSDVYGNVDSWPANVFAYGLYDANATEVSQDPRESEVQPEVSPAVSPKGSGRETRAKTAAKRTTRSKGARPTTH